ncbi:Collagen alpha-1(XVII) chain [Dirofilaria immitis]
MQGLPGQNGIIGINGRPGMPGKMLNTLHVHFAQQVLKNHHMKKCIIGGYCLKIFVNGARIVSDEQKL